MSLQSTPCGACGAYGVPLWARQHAPRGLLAPIPADIEHPHIALGGVTVQLEDMVIGCLDAVVGAVGFVVKIPPARRQAPAANHAHVIGYLAPSKGAQSAFGVTLPTHRQPQPVAT